MVHGVQGVETAKCRMNLKTVPIDSHGASVREMIAEGQIIDVQGVVLDGEGGVH